MDKLALDLDMAQAPGDIRPYVKTKLPVEFSEHKLSIIQWNNHNSDIICANGNIYNINATLFKFMFSRT